MRMQNLLYGSDIEPLMLQEGQMPSELAREAGYDYIAKYIENYTAVTNGKVDS